MNESALKFEVFSVCCKAEVKLNPIEWASLYHVEKWQAWCLKCGEPCKFKEKGGSCVA